MQLANDACIVLAEGMAGSEAAFAELMTKRARDLGLPVATFKNATGLPHPENKVTMRELVALTRHLYEAHPDYYRLYSQPEFEWNKILQRNKNPLIAANVGVDGLATGFARVSASRSPSRCNAATAASISRWGASRVKRRESRRAAGSWIGR